MRVYHFIDAKFAFEDLEYRRLKVARISKLNDPFELMAPRLLDSAARRAMREGTEGLDLEFGLLCFSRSWHNPVQWSHYADKHQGICLGFDVPDDSVLPVNYSPKRLIPDPLKIFFLQAEEERFRRLVLTTKFSHWRYEQEVRRLLRLSDCSRDGEHHFVEFGERLKLKEVIVGVRSDISQADLRVRLGSLKDAVVSRKARLAFRSFRVVEQRKKSLWA